MRFAHFTATAFAVLLSSLPTSAGRSPADLPVAPPPRAAGTRSLEPVGPPQHQAYKKKLAVIVGINYEGSNIQLRNAEQDAQKIHDLLVGCFGYKPEEVRLLLGKNATKL